MDKELIIQNTKEHIQNIRKNSPILNEREFQIALGKVVIDLKEAKKHNNDILKTIFAL